MEDYKKMGGLNDKNWDDRVRRITGTSNQADASADVTTPSADTSRPTISNDVANASASDAAIRRTVGGEEPASMKTRRIRRSNGAASARLANELSRVPTSKGASAFPRWPSGFHLLRLLLSLQARVKVKVKVKAMVRRIF